MIFCPGGTSLFHFTTFHKKRTYWLVFSLVLVFLPRKDQKEKYLILGGIMYIFFCQKWKEAHPLDIFQKNNYEN